MEIERKRKLSLQVSMPADMFDKRQLLLINVLIE